MGGSLVVAKYKGSLIGVNDYTEDVHDYLICPFCEDLGKILRVTFNKRGYFVAWKGEGGHICGRGGGLTYLRSDWEGTQLVEVITNENEEKEVIIDIFSGFNKGVKKVTKPGPDCTDEIIKREYNRYVHKRKVFRDVIRTVKQMKEILEKNELPTLRNLNFKYRVGVNEKLSIDELLKLPNLIEPRIIGKHRFVLFQADKASKLKKGYRRRYLNAYRSDGIDLSIAYDVVEKENPFRGLSGEFVLAYGKISKDKKNANKYYLNLANDFHLEKVDKEFGQLFFEDVELSAVDFKQYYKVKKAHNLTKEIEVREAQEQYSDNDEVKILDKEVIQNKEMKNPEENNQPNRIKSNNINRTEDSIRFRFDNLKSSNNEDNSSKPNQKPVGIKAFLKKLFRIS